MSGQETIDKRKAFMKEKILKPYLVAKKFAKEGTGSAADVASAARSFKSPMVLRTPFNPSSDQRFGSLSGACAKPVTSAPRLCSQQASHAPFPL